LRGDHRVFLLVSKDNADQQKKRKEKKEKEKEKEEKKEEEEEETDKRPTPENCHVLWCPAVQNELYCSVSDHFCYGTGECEQIKNRMMKGNTDTGNLHVQMAESHLMHINSRELYGKENIQERFYRTFALTRAMLSDGDYWMYDNEMPDITVEIIGKVGDLLRTKYLKEDNATLGLGVEDLASLGVHSLDAAMHSPDASRAALYVLLEQLKGQFLRGTELDGLRFSWRPGKPRKRKAE